MNFFTEKRTNRNKQRNRNRQREIIKRNVPRPAPKPAPKPVYTLEQLKKDLELDVNDRTFTLSFYKPNNSWSQNTWNFLFNTILSTHKNEIPKLIDLINNVSFLLPCDECNNHMQEYIKQTPIPTDTLYNIYIWMLNFEKIVFITNNNKQWHDRTSSIIKKSLIEPQSRSIQSRSIEPPQPRNTQSSQKNAPKAKKGGCSRCGGKRNANQNKIPRRLFM